MFWERNLRAGPKAPSTKKDNSPPGKKEALRRGMRKPGRGGGGAWGGGDGEGGSGAEGRPSVGTWTKTQNYLQILKEISGKVGDAASHPLAALMWVGRLRMKTEAPATAVLTLSLRTRYVQPACISPFLAAFPVCFISLLTATFLSACQGICRRVSCACLELKSQDDEELQWLMVAKQGKGVEKSEKRRESAETEYHRLLCEESMQQVRGGRGARPNTSVSGFSSRRFL